MKCEEVIEIARMADVGFGNSGGIMGNCLVGLSAIEAAFNEVERRTIEKCAQVADGADKYNRHISREIAAGIRALANQQEKQ